MVKPPLSAYNARRLGPYRYEVTLSYHPDYHRIVGANSRLEARVKARDLDTPPQPGTIPPCEP